jgi:Uma2 family endonuclease
MVTHMEGWLPRHRITVDEYYRMAEVGLLAQDARVELIEGEIIDRAPIGSRHGAAVDRLNGLLQRAVGDRATVRVQGSIRLDKSSEPQPDVALLKPRTDFYAAQHPTALDTLLIIEVSDTTFRYDRQVKVPLYARHGVPEVWIVDLKDRRVHFFRAPAGGEYADTSSVSEPAEIEVGALPGSAIDLSGVFGSS